MTEHQEPTPATGMQYVFRGAITTAVLVVGVVVFSYLKSTKPEPKKVERVVLGELVEIIKVQPDRQKVRVPANGQVLPAQQVAMSSEVGGRVVWMSEKLIPGNRLRAGDSLVRIDVRDFSLAMEQQAAQVDRAQTELQLEKSRKEIAEREWQLMGGGQPAEGSLAVRDPQLRTAEAALKAARSGLSRAKLSVDKTTVRAPFNAMVHQKNVDLGQLVGPAAPLATLVGTDAFWVQVSIPLERLAWIQVPGVDGAGEGARVVISQRLGDRSIDREGKVLRLLPDLDPMGRMARILVEIPDPLGLDRTGEAGGEKELPLLIGSYVNVEIEGREIDSVIELPREAVRGGDEVFVMTADDTLDVRAVTVVWRRPDTVLIGAGLEPGDKVVVSPLSAPVKGMKLRTAQDDGPDEKAGSSAPQAGPKNEPAEDEAAGPKDEPAGDQAAGPKDEPTGDEAAGDEAVRESPPAKKIANPSR